MRNSPSHDLLARPSFLCRTDTATLRLPRVRNVRRLVYVKRPLLLHVLLLLEVLLLSSHLLFYIVSELLLLWQAILLRAIRIKNEQPSLAHNHSTYADGSGDYTQQQEEDKEQEERRYIRLAVITERKEATPNSCS